MKYNNDNYKYDNYNNHWSKPKFNHKPPFFDQQYNNNYNNFSRHNNFHNFNNNNGYSGINNKNHRYNDDNSFNNMRLQNSNQKIH